MTDARVVTLNRRLRPLRLAFLVNPRDKESLRRIFQINTCLWGGRFNAIIPVYKKTPRYWIERPFRIPAAREIVSGYLDAFEPDYIVAMDKGLTAGLAFPDMRVLSPTDVLSTRTDEPIAYGVDVFEVFYDLYQKEFQFQRRHPFKVFLPIIKDRGMSLFMAACFGEFPADEGMRYLTKGYQDAFDAIESQIESNNFLKFFVQRKGYPFRMGSAGIRVHRHGWVEDPALFYMDATSPVDLIDFWNLRAIGWEILPLPRQWAEALIDDCNTVIKQNYRPYYHNKEMMHGTTIMRSRSSHLKEMEDFANRLKLPREEALSRQHWYPRMWDEWARDKDHVVRCSLTAMESDVETPVSNGRISFRNLSPEFADKFGGRGTPRWANIIEIRDYSGAAESAVVIPSGIPEIGQVLHASGGDNIWATREGIVIACENVDWNHLWSLPTGPNIFRTWLKRRGFSFEISGPGQIAAQAIRALGGTWGISLLANEEILKQLDKMAYGLVEVESHETAKAKDKPKVRAQTISQKKLWQLLLRTDGNRAHYATRRLNSLIAHKVLRIGLKLQCPHCSQHTWFDLAGLAEVITCERCLQTFNFPSASPPSDDWHYRAIGPFSVENYAQGSYCVALAIRVLGDMLHGEMTWVPSFKIKGREGIAPEADFGMFWREHRFNLEDPILILGECKSFDFFRTKDIQRMRVLGRQFPGAILAFCTLRKQLHPIEKKHIAHLARRGRRHLRAELWHNPVLILTGIELFSDYPPPYCWRDAGNNYAKFADSYRNHRGILSLCDATQQLHLGMESYGSWIEEERKKR